MMTRLLLASLQVAAWCTFAGASELYEYYVPGIPAGGNSCAAEAEALGKRVAQQGGVDIYQTRCERDRGGTFDISVSYRATLPLNVASTFNERLMDGQGNFATLAECQETLVAETGEFQSQTGLTPVMAYCFRDDHLDSRLRFFARIEAFGEPLVRPISENLLVNGRPLEPLDALSRRMEAAAKAFFPIRHLVVDDTPIGFHRVGLRYYATGHQPFSVKKLAAYRSERLCGDAATRMQTALTASVQAIGVFCAAEEFTTRLHLTAVLFESKYALRAETAPDEYDAFEKCDAARAGVLEYYRQQLGRDAIETLCDGSDRLYRVRVFSRLARPADQVIRGWLD